ncbi:odontogenic ameloblast-associated protein isoform X1 [Ochotona princeps]|uniref:odontogenic ameloblast-associated protein isoform X1 n=1 Tax=Ochotona princeps TaxID=9978 RepID=UPI0027153220|nr:odontogenic ameloblast-associated protein isoform X1 [Ochotona princeps]
MKILVLLGLLGTTLSAPLIPQRLLSASNSNELLLKLNNAQLLPLQLQGPFNSWTPFSGVVQQQAQIPGLPQFSLPTLEQLAGLFPSQIPFSGQASFTQAAQANPLDPSQPQTAPQTQHGPNHVLPYVIALKLPQEQTQMLQYYPVYVLLPWDQLQQTATQSPPLTGQQKFEEQVPVYNQYGYIPQQAEPATPGRQQQPAFDPPLGTVPEIAVLPAGGVIPYLQKGMKSIRHDSGGVFMPPASPKSSKANVLTSTILPPLTPELPEKKAKTDSLREP